MRLAATVIAVGWICVVLFGASSALFGCRPTEISRHTASLRTAEPAGATEAILAVWRDVYRRKDAPPAVEWHAPECRRAGGWAGVLLRGVCVAGWTPSNKRVIVVFEPGEPLAVGSLAHELWHAIEYRDGCCADLEHRSRAFRPGDHPECAGPSPHWECGIVERGNAAIARVETGGAP